MVKGFGFHHAVLLDEKLSLQANILRTRLPLLGVQQPHLAFESGVHLLVSDGFSAWVGGE